MVVQVWENFPSSQPIKLFFLLCTIYRILTFTSYYKINMGKEINVAYGYGDADNKNTLMKITSPISFEL